MEQEQEQANRRQHNEKKKAINTKALSRLNKLRKSDPRKLWDQVQELQRLKDASKLLPSDVKYLESLQRDLKDLQRITKWKPPHELEKAKIVSTKSVFFHPKLNPTGKPPQGHEWHSIDEFDSESTDESTAEIPMPLEPYPETGTATKKTPKPVSKTVYENEPELRVDAKMFVPRNLD